MLGRALRPRGKGPKPRTNTCALYMVAWDAAALSSKNNTQGQPGTRTHTAAPYCVFLYLTCILFFFLLLLLFFLFPTGEDS